MVVEEGDERGEGVVQILGYHIRVEKEERDGARAAVLRMDDSEGDHPSSVEVDHVNVVEEEGRVEEHHGMRGYAAVHHVQRTEE